MIKEKILVTGGAGYIGSHTIIEMLQADRFEIISIDNYSNSDPSAYDRIEQITGKKIRYYSCDLCDKVALEQIFQKESNVRGIIHFAALKSVPESVANPDLYFRNNMNSLENLLSCAERYSVPHFIFSSSCSVYGNIQQLPVKEDSPLSKPESPYAETKINGERMLKEFVENTNGLHAIALRYFNPVGAHSSGLNGELPNGRPNNLFPIITGVAIGKMKELVVFGNDYSTRDGTCVRDYIHVSDIARAHILALQKLMRNEQREKYDVINLGSGEGVTVSEALVAFEKETGIKPAHRFGPRREGDVMAIYSDCSKAKKELGWVPEFNLKEMVRTAWKWEQHLSHLK